MKRASIATTRTPPSSGRTSLSGETNGRARVVRKRPPRIALVVACSQRKRAQPPKELRLASINAAPEQRAVEWRRRVRDVEAAQHPAHELYIGDHWRAACEAFRLAQLYSSRAELWVISAGYGLIEGDKSIKPYSATFASGSIDSVWRGSADGVRKECLGEWWQRLPHDAELPDLLAKDATIVIAAGAAYLTAIATDVATAVDHDRSGDRVSVVSAGTRANAALLPIDGRFRSTVGGTDGALNARLLAMLAVGASSHGFRRSAMAASLAKTAQRLPQSNRSAGAKMTDQQVVGWIDNIRVQSPDISRTRALREFRRSGAACEQTRFEAIWRLTFA